jgi:polar amino acid transport system permease protein
VDVSEIVGTLLGLYAVVGNIWDDSIGAIWDDTAGFRTQYYDLQLMIDEVDPVLEGFWYTIQLSLIGGVLSLAWGLVLAVFRQLPGRVFAPVRWVTIAYIDAFRGVPLLLVILLISGGLGALAFEGVIPRDLGVPRWFGLPDPFWYGIMAITLTYGAYMAEVYRAGIEAVPSGQMEAARSLGMSHGKAMRYIIVPQAVRKVIPPLLNDFIALMKDTSLVSVIGLVEVVQAGRDVQSEFFNSSALTLGAILFLIVTIPLARLVDWLIAREQKRTERGGGDTGEIAPAMQPLPSAGGGAGAA